MPNKWNYFIMQSGLIIKCGVPQGSISGGFFFLLYINDLPQCLNKTKPRLFVDDTSQTAAGESVMLKPQ